MGLGFGYRTGTEDYEYKSTNPAGFYIEPILTLPIVLGSRQFDYSGADGEFKVGVGFIAAFGMGYAF
jgi:hypothetical protein